MKLKIGLLIALVLQSLSAAAGVGAHGGNVVFCPNIPGAVTLDYFNAALPTVGGPVSIVDVTRMSEDQAFNFIRSRFDGSPFQALFDEHAATLGPISTWISADLKSIDDSNEPYALPNNCFRKTGAARQGTMMYADPSILSKLSPAQTGLLHAHEVLYEISRQDSSAGVRDLFRVMLANTLDYDSMNRRMQSMNLKFAIWDYFHYGNWESDPGGPPDSPTGYFHQDFTSFNDPRNVLDYLESDPHSGGYKSMAHYEMDCTLNTHSCVVKSRTKVVGTPPNLQDCVITMSAPKAMAITCNLGTSRVTTYNFHRTNWDD